MTTAMPPGRAATMPTGDTFVVRTDRSRVRRTLVLQMVSSGLLLLISVMRVFTEEGWWLALDAGLVVTFVVLIGAQVRDARRLLRADALVEVAPSGMRVNDLRRGMVDVPWDDVTSVREDIWGRVFVRSSHGRRGRLLVPTRSADHDSGQVLAAVHHFSGGRL